MNGVYEEGEYRIRCQTRNGGLRNLTANINGQATPDGESQDFRQKWRFQHLGNGWHRIINCGTGACVEAYPKDGVTRMTGPRDHDGPQDQKWKLPMLGSGGQITCDTKNRGTCVLEAFPNHYQIRPVGYNGDQDQFWTIVRW